MLTYSVAKGTAGDFTTHATPGSETGTYFVAAGSARSAYLWEIMCGGKNVDQTALNAIELRIMTATTASTGGTAITPAPMVSGGLACSATAANGQTISSTGRVNHGSFSFSGTGQGGYVATDMDSAISVGAGSGDSFDVISASGKASMLFTCGLKFKE